MEFGKHIGKGIWAFADKSLPAVYGIAYIFLVIRVLPPQEYGAFVLVQTIFTFVTALGFAFAFQPFIKFASETSEHGPYSVASLTLCGGFFFLVTILLFTFKGFLIPVLDPEGKARLRSLLWYVPMLLTATLYRSYAMSLLQTTYKVVKIFWIDAVYFLGTLMLIIVAQKIDRFHTAEDLITLNLLGMICSTVLSIVLTFNALKVRFSFQKKAFVEILEFGKYIFGGSAVYAFFSQLDVFFVSSYTGVVGVAIYSVAKIFNRITDMLTQVLQMFLIPFSSRAHTKGEYDKLRITAEKAICFSTLLLLPVFIMMVVFPEWILHVLYKGKYPEAAPLVRIFSFLIFIIPWNGVISSYLVGIGKVKEGFYFGLVLLVVALSAYSIFTPFIGVTGTAMGYVVSFLVYTILLVVFIRRYVPISIVGVVKKIKDVQVFLLKNRP